MKCVTTKALYRLVPLRVFRAFLIRHHFSICPSCIDRMDVEPLIAREIHDLWNPAAPEEDAWREIHDHLESHPKAPTKSLPSRGRARRLVWTLTAALVVAFLLLLPLIDTSPGSPRPVPSQDTRISIRTIKIRGHNADRFVYQPRNEKNSLYIWAQAGRGDDPHENSI